MHSKRDANKNPPLSKAPTLHNATKIFSTIKNEDFGKGDCNFQKQFPKTHQDDGFPMKPSEYQKEMLLSTRERTESLLKSAAGRKNHQVKRWKEQLKFQPMPPVVVFQQFQSGNCYSVNLVVRNVTEAAENLRMTCEKDPFFSVELRNCVLNVRVAAGMAQSYTIRFQPQENRDYEYRVQFVTQYEVFSIPVIAIGPRPILDFPDTMELPVTSVKVSSSKTIVVRNVGHAPAIFSIFSHSSNLCMEPSKGVLEENSFTQFTVNFFSSKPGDFQNRLFIRYESGETLYLEVNCSVRNSPILLDSSFLEIDDTFLTLSKSRTFQIHNQSDHIVKFQWMTFESPEEEQEHRKKYNRLFEIVRDQETDRNEDLKHYNLCSVEGHASICQRIYEDELESLENESFLFGHRNFVIRPLEGEIWPQSSKDITVLFQPDEIGKISNTAYLEATGCENRLPIRISGTGKGPIFQLNLVRLDVGEVFLGSVHNYEIVCTNKGLIPGTLIPKCKTTDFRGVISIQPSYQKLNPDEFRSFNLTFSSQSLGEFIERVDFVVKESLETISMYLKGCIVAPTLHFNKQHLDFGIIPLGFTRQQEVTLQNSSLVPVPFVLTIPEDGNKRVVTHESFAKSLLPKPTLPRNPCEFKVVPSEGVVSSQNSVKIKVSYTPNLKKTDKTSLQARIRGCPSAPPLQLSILRVAKIAQFEVTPLEVNLGSCFLNYPYTRFICIENKSNVEGFFCFLPQEVSDSAPILYSLSTSQGYLKPGQSRSLALTVIASLVGPRTCSINLLTFGRRTPVSCCTLRCTGTGPTVTVSPEALDWGEVQVLEPVNLKLLLVNDSPIPAEFKVTLEKRTSAWEVTPISGEISANRSIELQVTICARDPVKYCDRVLIAVINSQTINVPLRATGVGCSIVFDPRIIPRFDVGLVFSHQDVIVPVRMRNAGTRTYQLIWSNSETVKFLNKDKVQSPVCKKFLMEPIMVNLEAEASEIVYCKIRWEKNQCVTEEWYLHGFVEGSLKKEVLGKSLFSATFIEPRVIFSKNTLQFRLDLWPDYDILQETDDLELENGTGVNLTAHVSVEPPFSILTFVDESVQELELKLLPGKKLSIRVKFHVDRFCDLKSAGKIHRGILKIVYDEHPVPDEIKCRGIINLPTVKFHPKEINFQCQLGSSVEEILQLRNSTPVPVVYRLLWIEDSIAVDFIQRESIQSICTQELDPFPELQSDGFPEDEDAGEVSSKGLTPPLNSPVSEEFDNANAKMSFGAAPGREEAEATQEEMKEFLFPFVEPFHLEDYTEVQALDCLKCVSESRHFIDEVVNVVPKTGKIPPYFNQNLFLAFHGFKPIEIKARLLCEILRGTAEIINIHGIVDEIKFSVNKRTIDFGNQIILEKCHSTLELENPGTLKFSFSIDSKEKSSLQINPDDGTVKSNSTTIIDINYQPKFLGPFEEYFELQVEHQIPLKIVIKGTCRLPQVYLNLPCEDALEKLPIEFGYESIGLFISEIFVDSKNHTKLEENPENLNTEGKITKFLREEDREILENDGWDILPDRDHACPDATDIRMAIEKSLVTKFVKENFESLLINYDSEETKDPIPCLFLTEYKIDLGFVIFGEMTHFSSKVTNYDNEITVSLKIRKFEGKKRLEKRGISIDFKSGRDLSPEDSVPLNVTFHPENKKLLGRRIDVKQQFFLEVQIFLGHK